MLIGIFKYLFHYSYKLEKASNMLKWKIGIEIYILNVRLGNMFYPNMQSIIKKSLSAISYKT